MKNVLLTRDDFRESVFKRDGHKCIICHQPGVDAHHIIDRKLWDDGGYYLNNGATLCSDCHIQAEKCILTVEKIRESAGITNIILPPNLLSGVIYDKWGNAEDFNAKYPRSLHAKISLGTTSDDRFIPDGYVSEFAKNEFDSLFKLVRQKHVKTDIHWTKNWKKAKLKWEY